jgi:hypothetical protein
MARLRIDLMMAPLPGATVYTVGCTPIARRATK